MPHPMATAHTAPLGMQVSLNEAIAVSKDIDRRHAGSCNGCTSSTQASEYETVTEVQLRGLSFRLCPVCARTLKLAL